MTQNGEGGAEDDILSAIRRIAHEESGGAPAPRPAAAPAAPAAPEASGRTAGGAMVLTPTMRVQQVQEDDDSPPPLVLTRRRPVGEEAPVAAVLPDADPEEPLAAAPELAPRDQRDEARELRAAFGRETEEDLAEAPLRLRLDPARDDAAQVSADAPLDAGDEDGPPAWVSAALGGRPAPEPEIAPAPEPEASMRSDLDGSTVGGAGDAMPFGATSAEAAAPEAEAQWTPPAVSAAPEGSAGESAMQGFSAGPADDRASAPEAPQVQAQVQADPAGGSAFGAPDESTGWAAQPGPAAGPATEPVTEDAGIFSLGEEAVARTVAEMSRAELEALITEQLRRDLSGELGARISANIRALVQREVEAEVARALNRE